MDSVELGRQVFFKRKEKRLSQSKLGEMAGISRNYVSQIEHGSATNISMKLINQLAVALGATTAELIDDSTPIMIPKILRNFGIERNLSYEVIDKLARIPKQGREPKSIQEWQELYHAIAPFIEGEVDERF